MGTFLVYIIKSALCLTLLYLPYTLLLRKERLHRLNRMALLAILAAFVPFPAFAGGVVWRNVAFVAVCRTGRGVCRIDRPAWADGAFSCRRSSSCRMRMFLFGLWCVSVFISQVWRCRCPSVCTSSSVCVGRYLAVVCGARAFQTVLRSTVMPVPCRLSVGCTAL